MKIYNDIKFDTNPILIASWAGIGKVGLLANSYLRLKINAQILAEIDMSSYFFPEAVFVKNGIIDKLKIPAARIYFSQNPDVLIFESDSQPAGYEGLTVAKSLIKLAKNFGVKKIFTIAAFPQNISHKTETQVFGAFTDKELSSEFGKFGVIPMPEGYIAGLNGAVLDIAKSQSIGGGCFLGTIPVFAANMNYPKAALKIIELLENILNISIDKSEINDNITACDYQFTVIEERLKQFPGKIFSAAGMDINPFEEILEEQANDTHQEVIPPLIAEKIERLFNDVQNDKTRANALKKELDRWNVYDLYEDRFLKLFKFDENQND